MSQFQPHPNPADSKPKLTNVSRNVKRASKRTRLPIMFVMIIIIFLMIFGLALSIIVPIMSNFDKISEWEIFDTENNDDFYSDWSSAEAIENFSSYDDLETKYPELAKVIAPYKEKINAFFDSKDSFLYEDYDVSDGDLDWIYLSEMFYDVDGGTAEVVYSCYGDEWTENFHITMYGLKSEPLNENLIFKMADYVGANEQDIKELCQEFYTKYQNTTISEEEFYVDDTVFYDNDYRLDMSMTFSGESNKNDAYRFLDFSLSRNFEA